MTLLTWLFSRSKPRPWPSTPMLFDTIVRSRAPLSRNASIRSNGLPHNPNPPTAMVMLSRTMPASASVALGRTLFMN